MDFSVWDQIMTRIFMPEGIIGELSKVISECNNFLKNCLSNFCISPLGLKKKTSSTESINCSFTSVNYGLRDRIYVAKLILQIRHLKKKTSICKGIC